MLSPSQPASVWCGGTGQHPEGRPQLDHLAGVFLAVVVGLVAFTLGKTTRHPPRLASVLCDVTSGE